MRRALATLSLTIAALTFILRFNPQTAVNFAAGSGPAGPAASDRGTTSTTEGATTTGATAMTVGSTTSQADTTTTTAPTSTTTAAPTTTTVAPKVIDGAVISTEWGPVQVEITVSGGTITAVRALQTPDHTRESRQINDYVKPIYSQAALQAQSANFWGVSGATVTWWGYTNSLQSALDQAGL